MMSVPLVAAVFVLWFSLQKTRGVVRSYHQRCAVELRQLLALLTHRHVIVSHFLDAVPSQMDRLFDREGMEESRQSAIRRLGEIDPIEPTRTELRGLGDNERQLFDLVADLVAQVNESEELLANESISACLTGLEESKSKIVNSLSIYNSAAITYNIYLKARWPSLVAQNAVNEAEFDQFAWGSNHSETILPD